MWILIVVYFFLLKNNIVALQKLYRKILMKIFSSFWIKLLVFYKLFNRKWDGIRKLNPKSCIVIRLYRLSGGCVDERECKETLTLQPILHLESKDWQYLLVWKGWSHAIQVQYDSVIYRIMETFSDNGRPQIGSMIVTIETN